MIKYVLCPGWVTSKNDGDSHWIGALELARLYGVPLQDCLVLESGALVSEHPGLLPLTTSYNGAYTLRAAKTADLMRQLAQSTEEVTEALRRFSGIAKGFKDLMEKEDD